MNRQDAKNAKILKEPSERADAIAKLVIGAALEVHRLLGPGYLEAVYEAALCVELEERQLQFLRQAPVAVQYKGRAVGEGRIDVLVQNILIVELKTVDALTPIHVAQTMSYLKATRLPLGLLINFKVSLLRDGLKRVVLS